MTAPTRHTDANPFVDPGRAGETPPQTKTSSSSIMNCFQHTPESCGALHNPCGGAPHKESISPQTRPNRLHNPRLLIQAPCTSALAQNLPFSPDLMRITHARPLNPAALAFVPFGIVLVRVRVRVGKSGQLSICKAGWRSQTPLFLAAGSIVQLPLLREKSKERPVGPTLAAA